MPSLIYPPTLSTYYLSLCSTFILPLPTHLTSTLVIHILIHRYQLSHLSIQHLPTHSYVHLPIHSPIHSPAKIVLFFSLLLPPFFLPPLICPSSYSSTKLILLPFSSSFLLQPSFLPVSPWGTPICWEMRSHGQDGDLQTSSTQALCSGQVS